MLFKMLVLCDIGSRKDFVDVSVYAETFSQAKVEARKALEIPESDELLVTLLSVIDS